jgi:shikimate dehydrogenase
MRNDMVSQLNGATRLYPIIGDPIEYVESPVRLTATFDARGHNGVCIPIQVAERELDAAMGGLSAMANVDGILVTMPHKAAAFAYCATSSARASTLGAVSVMRRNPDRTWHGDALDGIAFVQALTDRGARVERARALLIGAGSAGSQIALALLEAGARELVIHDIDDARTSVLVRRLAHFGSSHVTAGPPDPTGFDLVCHASPLGMEEGDPLPIDTALLAPTMVVGDVIAGHGVTPLINAAEVAGCRVSTGVDMVDATQHLIADFMLGRGTAIGAAPSATSARASRTTVHRGGADSPAG